MSSSQPPVRNRTIQALSSTQGPMQNNIVPREASPSPSFRERQRTIKAHSMPIVPSLGQILSGNPPQPNISQPSPTGSNGSLPSRRSPPAASRISPVTAKLSTMAVNARGDLTPERAGSPPSLLHTQSTPAVSQISGSPPLAAHQPRPVPRMVPPQFLTQYQSDDKWHVTPELLAEIERADQQQGQLQGTMGVAYAGGAASNSNLHIPSTLAKDPAVERVRAGDRSSPKEFEGGVKRQTREKEREASTVRESPKTRERSHTTSSISSQHPDTQPLAQRTPEYRGSPPFHTPMASPGERTAGYTQYIPDSYSGAQGNAQQQTRKPAPAVSGESPLRSTPPGVPKLSSQSPTAQSANRVADRALPLQEEPEEDVGQDDFTEHEPDYASRHHGSPTPSSDLYPEGNGNRYETRRDHSSGSQRADDDDDDETLNEESHDHLRPDKSDDEDSGFTPRSPSTTLPERPRDERYSPNGTQYIPSPAQYAQAALENQKTVRKARTGSTDQLGMRSLDPTLFHANTMNGTRNHVPDANVSAQRPTLQTHMSAPPQQYVQAQQAAAQRQNTINSMYNRPNEQYQARSMPPLSPHFEDLQGVFDNPTSSYLQTFLQSPTPDGRNAPVPPTPLTQTAAPSPAPLSAMPTGSDIEPRQIGSPYPYPFAHIRRTALSAAQNAATSTFDPNELAHVRDQIQMQMQIYALNNGLAPPSESTFSPSSTPFPGMGYNPWAFMHQQQQRQLDSTMSMRSSPSHEPLPLPLPPVRNRTLRRRENSGNLRTPAPRRRVKPPPRVESTQPRDTSPEPSSGEETAGELNFVDQYIPTEQTNGSDWQNGEVHAAELPEHESDWIDDDDDGADMLQLEYHPSYILSVEKRRRRFETRWESLTEIFQALDRETDTPIMVLAAPAHGTKMYSLTSRSIRSDPSLIQSANFTKIRNNFSSIVTQRRANRAKRKPTALVDHLTGPSATSPDGSQADEGGLRRALEAALGSLGALGALYDQREARWREEMQRLANDRQHVELLLQQALGPQNGVNGVKGRVEEDHTSLLG